MRRIQSTLLSLLALSGTAYADSIFNLTQGVSPVSRDVYQLHMIIFWICVVIGVLVFGVMFYAILHHRKSKGAKPANFHSHPVLEVTWTIVPAIILVLMAIPATKVLFRMNNYEKESITIKITGYQWKWQYEYMEDGIKFFSNLSTPYDQIHNLAPKSENYLREVDHPLVLPIHKKIRLLITSNDVNHAWWVPDLAVKRDAIGGFINEAWAIIDKPGIYRGQCAELCGVNHAYMPIVIVATTEEGYQDWLAQQKGQASSGEADTTRAWTMKELMAHGEQVYSHICAACHQPGGVGMPPTFPALKGSKVATGLVNGHVDVVVNGKTGTAMQAFKNQLSDIDIASVITYERNAFGNNTGSMVQPIHIKAIRDGMTIEDALKVKPTGKAAAVKTSAGDKPDVAAASAAPAAAMPATAGDANQPAAPAPVDDLKSAMARGEKVYLATCAACHQPGGAGMPPTFPAMKGSPIATGPVAGHIDRVLNGKPGTAMMPFKDQLNDQDLADVITYERNAWGNNTGTHVKPGDIKAARGQGQKK